MIRVSPAGVGVVLDRGRGLRRHCVGDPFAAAALYRLRFSLFAVAVSPLSPEANKHIRFCARGTVRKQAEYHRLEGVEKATISMSRREN